MGAANPNLWGLLIFTASLIGLCVLIGWAFFPHWRE